MKRFLSTKNKITIIMLWGLVAFMSSMIAIGLIQEHLSCTPIVILSLVTALIIWVLLDTRYVIKNHFLLYRSGPFRGRVDIEKIQKIQYFSGKEVPVTKKPALDTKGFIISSQSFADLYVSPQKKEIFIEELLKINPRIEVV